MSENYCPHCMRPAAGGKCPSCGGDTSWRGQKGIDLPVGTVLNGGNGLRTYQIGAARGKGGFGITYVARETNSGRRVAVKEYFPTRCAFRAGNEVNVQTMTGQEDVFQAGMNNFLEEGKMLLSQDDLSCVVHVIDYFQANGTAYLVMEYLDGVALHAQMTRMGGRIPVSELMPRLAPLLRDIGQLHRRGVIHRDISPDNIMWMPDGGLKLLDFGSARSMENGKSMTVLMKHGFSPIEQYRSKGQGPYTDIYALAATIYYCVTGVIPPAAVERLDEDGLQSPTALGAALTVDQETALLWALSIQPNARPQSMEEFAALLYKEAPQQGPVTTGGGSTGWTTGGNGGNSGWTTSGGSTGWTTGGGSGSTGWTTGGGSGSTGWTTGGGGSGSAGWTTGGGSGSAGWTTGGGGGSGGNSWTGGSGGSGGGKNKTPIIIGGVAAAVVILVAALIIAMSGGNGGTADNSAGISYAPATDTPYVPPETPNIHTGVTDDGYLYEIVNKSYAVITGYEGNSGIYEIPYYIEDVPVTAIADNAFAGVPTDEFVYLPPALETIGAGAFRGCSDLQYVVALSDVTTQTTSFSGCDSLWFVYSTVKNVSGWDLPIGTHLYYSGMETGVGRLEDANIYDGLLIGWTEDDTYVLLDVQPGMTEIDLEDVDWICSGALNNLAYGAMVNLGDYTLYSYETYSNALCNWHAPDGALSDMWMISCGTARKINSTRPSGATQILPDIDLIYAAMVRAEELGETQDYDNRPNDKGDWKTALTDQGISYSWPSWAAGYNYSDYQEMADEAVDYTTETFASAISQGDYAGQYYSRVGVGTAPQADGRYAWWGFVMIP